MSACHRPPEGVFMSQSVHLLLYLIGLLSGGVGGAGAAGWHVLGGRVLNRSMLIAYVVVGAFVGLFVDVWVLIWALSAGVAPDTLVHHLAGLGLGSGFVASTALVILRKLTAVVLKWRGVQVELRMRGDGDA